MTATTGTDAGVSLGAAAARLNIGPGLLRALIREGELDQDAGAGVTEESLAGFEERRRLGIEAFHDALRRSSADARRDEVLRRAGVSSADAAALGF